MHLEADTAIISKRAHETRGQTRRHVVHTVQVGEGWFEEESGGLNRYYVDLIRRLPEIGVGVRGLVAGSDMVSERSAGVVRPFAPRHANLAVRLASVRSGVRRALDERPGQLLVAHFALYALPCLPLIRQQPFVVHFHGPWAEESRAEGGGAISTRLKHWLEHTVYSRAARFVVLSSAFSQVLQQSYGIAAERIRVIPGGVDTERFAVAESRAEARRRLDWPLDRPIALVVRRLVRRMGLEALIASVADARRRSPDLLLLIAGRGPLDAELRQRVEEAGLSDHVRLLGFVPDAALPLAYRGANVSVVPSVALEGFGLIVAESLAAGTPVLVTDVGGLPETIEDLAPQCIVRDATPAGLGRALGAALAGDLPLPDADACRRRARERFDWSVVASRVSAVYAEVAR